MEQIQNLSSPLGRILISLVFLLAGITKITSYASTQAYMEQAGLPGMLLPLVILFEIAAAIAIIVGWKTRIIAFLLAGFCILSAVMFHTNFADQTQMVMFLKNLGLAGGFLLLVANGSGAYALDNR